MSLGQALEKSTARLNTRTSSARLEAELLLSHTTGLSRTTLLAHQEIPIDSRLREEYFQLVAKRASGYPLPYLTGTVEFYGLEFEVNDDVLIPRPETETLVELAIERQPKTIIDVGTGSGCIAVTLAVNLPQAIVYATDISMRSLRVASVNASRHGVSNRIHLVQCDIIAPLTERVDLIVSNPPYVAEHEWSSLPRSVRLHEPRLALHGGRDGLHLVNRLLTAVAQPLPSSLGQRPQTAPPLLIEIGAAQGELVLQMATAAFPRSLIRLHQDLAGRDRVLEIAPRAA